MPTFPGADDVVIDAEPVGFTQKGSAKLAATLVVIQSIFQRLLAHANIVAGYVPFVPDWSVKVNEIDGHAATSFRAFRMVWIAESLYS